MAETLQRHDPKISKLLEGKVAIVTGASRGIGATTARYFADAGAAVVLAARSADQLDELRSEIGKDRALFVPTDVSNEEALRALVDKTLATFGRLDAAVNNAAGGGHYPKPLAEVSSEEFDSSYAVNLRGVFLAMKYEIPALLRSGGGSIVNISSVAGERGWPGLTAYAATKHGIGGLTKVAALDYASQGVRVNTIAPGPIETDRIAALPDSAKDEIKQAIPMSRIGRPEEVAALAAWLCSEQASFITGASIAIDGGRMARG
jgi:NAD(P)-dependent dehydrogenase (short-subunit alcohol dehydrogenase family)